jgi:hypothetical protein
MPAERLIGLCVPGRSRAPVFGNAEFGSGLKNATMGCMATHLQRAQTEPAGWRLTAALDAKLAELRERGFEIQWIESSRADLTRLLIEGGDAAIRLDPDPTLDRAWYGETEIRHGATQDMTWVFVRGEVAAGDVSAHVVSAPDRAS